MTRSDGIRSGERRVFARRFIYSVLWMRSPGVGPEFDGGEVSFSVENEARNLGYFDERKMMRVVTNIARNARQAMHESGMVKWVLSDVEGGGLLFRIEDNGPGIPETIRDTLFEAFTTSGKPQGTGLGLAIVRRIVEDHGARIVHADGLGTCFVYACRVHLRKRCHRRHQDIFEQLIGKLGRRQRVRPERTSGEDSVVDLCDRIV